MALIAMTDEKLVKLRVDIDEDYRNRIKALAFRMGISMGELITMLVTSGDSLESLENKHFGGSK